MRVLTSTFFNMLSVVFIRFIIRCFSVTTFCSLFFHLSRLISLLFASGLKIGHGGLFFHFFHFLWRWFVFVFDFDDEKKETKFLIRETSSQSRRTLTRSRARLFTNTLSAYIFVICKIRNRRSTKTHTQAKRVCLFFLFVTKE